MEYIFKVTLPSLWVSHDTALASSTLWLYKTVTTQHKY